MKIGDKLTVQSRSVNYSLIFMRVKSYSYHALVLQIEAIFPNTLVVHSEEGDETQLISKSTWAYLKKTKQNWISDENS